MRAPRLYARKITRKAVFARDGYSCQYCGATSRLTVDHVVPRSRGGGTSWENMVTSCAPCNLRKADRLPHEAGMQPRTRPRPPAPLVFITLAAPEVHPAWELYLGPSGRRLKTSTS